MASVEELSTSSPSGRLRLDLSWSDGSIEWRIEFDSDELLGTSPLGIELDGTRFERELSVEVVREPSRETHRRSLVAGKRRTIERDAVGATLELTAADGHRLALDCVVFDDAVAYRFRHLDTVREPIRDLTEFRVGPKARKWVQRYDDPGLHQPASEAAFIAGATAGFALAEFEGWALPALFEVDDRWLLIAEVGGSSSMPGVHLDQVPGELTYRLAPAPDGQVRGPQSPVSAPGDAMPWRVVVVSDRPGGIVESDAFTLLADDPVEGDFSWVRPGRVSWSWWSDSESPVHADRLGQFTQLAADFGWEYTLIDANWTQLAEAELDRLIADARALGVGVMLWYNSGGSHNIVTEQPRDRMIDATTRRAEMATLVERGIVGIKVDFFHSDHRSMQQLALDIASDAADHGLLANFHGITAPRGWHVTWPNLLTTEAVRGAEQYKFDPRFPAIAPRHNVTLAFTRNVVGPMDYTPMTVSDVDFAHVTTAAHELALGVVFESALQHPADKPSAYRDLGPQVADFLRRLPSVWDDLQVLEGHPSTHIVCARRHGEQWWLAGINGEDRPRSVSVDLARFGGSMHLVADAGGRDDIEVRHADGRLELVMAPHGGFAAWPAV